MKISARNVLKGTVTQWKWSNPHVWIYLSADDDKGGTVDWAIEGRTPGQLVRAGWSRTILKAGETITVTERGKVIGQIVPLKPSLNERMQGLVDTGIVDWNMQKLEPYQPPAINTGERQISDLVIEDRQ